MSTRRKSTVNRDVLKASSPEDAVDRAMRLPGASKAHHVRVTTRGRDTYSVRFLLAPGGVKPRLRSLSHAICATRGCGHELDDHYNGYCSGWGCFCGR